jgi:hypothetical protein
MPQLDAGLIVQVNVEDDANCRFEIVMILKSLRRRKQDAIVPVLPKQSLYSPECSGIIIDDKDDISI